MVHFLLPFYTYKLEAIVFAAVGDSHVASFYILVDYFQPNWLSRIDQIKFKHLRSEKSEICVCGSNIWKFKESNANNLSHFLFVQFSVFETQPCLSETPTTTSSWTFQLMMSIQTFPSTTTTWPRSWLRKSMPSLGTSRPPLGTPWMMSSRPVLTTQVSKDISFTSLLHTAFIPIKPGFVQEAQNVSFCLYTDEMTLFSRSPLHHDRRLRCWWWGVLWNFQGSPRPYHFRPSWWIQGNWQAQDRPQLWEPEGAK